MKYEDAWFRLEPLSGHREDVLLKLDERTWNSMTNQEKSGWFADEVEQRWQKLKTEHPNVEVLEVRWSKKKWGSFPIIAIRIAKRLGLRTKSELTNSKIHTNTAPNDHRPNNQILSFGFDLVSKASILAWKWCTISIPRFVMHVWAHQIMRHESSSLPASDEGLDMLCP
eukprot:CAMPEP_0170193436 /NCGR_PEP_ID=MMETSP0040_2-20121228/56844_1 /TAXON_ID=641309 /ORGANISM="Lotharella oceanica, Strain CCMP622" /LENGTH=168 /DNA_ID=CAMNT_0010442059 /DNA_START=134 /DNA_END=640 /DNA_ORIENTATION=+